MPVSRLTGLVRIAQQLNIDGFDKLQQFTVAEWWVAMREVKNTRAIEYHLRLIKASGLRFADWPPRQLTALSSDMTASRRWARLVTLLTSAGVLYIEQLEKLSYDVLLMHVPSLTSRQLPAITHALDNWKS